jgi:hypothetical protein
MRRAIPVIILLILALYAVSFEAVAAPYRHPKTGVLFTESVGGANLVNVMDYEKEHPGLGVGVMYRSDTFKADVFLYDMGTPPIPTGVKAPLMTAQFKQAMGDVRTLEKRGLYKDVAVQVEKETVRIGGFPFLHGKMTYAQDGIKRVSHLYLTGYKGEYLKVRVTYYLDDAANGEKSMAELLDMLGNSMRDASR